MLEKSASSWEGGWTQLGFKKFQRIISFESNGFDDQQRSFLFKDCDVWGIEINAHFQLLQYQV